MTSGRNGTVLRSIQTLFDAGATGGLTDEQLLDRFLARRDEAAFEAFVVRHGPMVLSVCRNVLNDTHDAQDAFQATFLVLARKAGSVRRRGSLASWLFGVARRVAAKTKSDAARRRTHEREVAELATEKHVDEGEPQDFSVLHEEVGRLPEKYRAPVVLCYLQGMTYEAAAECLRCPVGTLSVRLKRARERLQVRLTRRGVTASVAGVIPKATTAGVSPALVGLTVRAATELTAGRAAVSATAALLAERTVSAMRFKTIGMSLLGGGMIALVAMTSVGSKERLWAQETPERPQKAKDQRLWIKQLPSGATVELVGVSSHPSGVGTWWVPDGSPLLEPPYAKSGTRLNPDNSQQAREIAVRTKHLPGKANAHRWQIPSGGSSTSGSPHDQGDKLVPDVGMIATTFPKGQNRCTVRFGVASGPWKTETTNGPEGGSAQGREKLSVIFGKPHEERGKTAVTISHDNSEDDLRLVAVDHEGKEHAPSRVQSLGVKGHSQLEVEYDLPLPQVKEFRLQSRPFEWAVFEDVALNPRLN